MAVSPQDYILSFDFESINRQVDSLRENYEKLSESISQTTSKLREDFHAISNDVSYMAGNLNLILTQIHSNLSNTSSTVDSVLSKFSQLDEVTGKVSKNLKDMSDVPGSTGEGYGGASVGGRGGSLPKDVAHLKGTLDGFTGKASFFLKGVPSFLTSALNNFASEFNSLIASGVRSAIKSRAGGAAAGGAAAGGAAAGGGRAAAAMASPAGIITSAIAGVFALAGYGVYDELTRIKPAEGALKSIVQPATDAFSERGEEGIKWYSKFQLYAKDYYNITLEQSGKVAEVLVNYGFKTKQFWNDISRNDQEYKVKDNIALTQLAMDSFFRLSEGTFSTQVAETVVNFGGSLDKAQERMQRLYFAAQRTGTAWESFVTGVLGASQALKQYGIDAKDIDKMVFSVMDKYQKGGIKTSQMAGQMAVEGIQSLAQGIDRMIQQGGGYAAKIAAQMDDAPDEAKTDPRAAKQWLEGRLARVSSGEDKDFASKLILASKDAIMDITGGNKIQFKEIFRNFGVNIDMAEQLYSREGVFRGGKVGAETSAQKKAFSEAFKTRGEQLSPLQKAQTSLIRTLAEIGGHLFKVLTGIFGVLTTIGKAVISVPRLINATSAQRDVFFNNMSKSFDDSLGIFKEGINKAFSGESFDKMDPHMKELLTSIKPMMGGLDLALGNWWGDSGEMPESLIDQAKFIRDQATQNPEETAALARGFMAETAKDLPGRMADLAAYSLISMPQESMPEMAYNAVSSFFFGNRKSNKFGSGVGSSGLRLKIDNEHLMKAWDLGTSKRPAEPGE